MRQRFAKGLGGTLRYLPPEVAALGVPSAAAVSLTTSTGLAVPVPVTDAIAAIDPETGALSFVLVAANTPDPLVKGNLYRAVWTYTIAGVEYQGDELYEVNQRLLKPVLVVDDVTPLLPAAWDELLEGGVGAVATFIDTAWNDLLDDLVGKGYRPDLIMDVDRLRRPHRSRTIATLYGSFGPAWIDAAMKKESEYLSDLDQALSSPGWYDKDSSGTGSDSETKIATITCTR